MNLADRVERNACIARGGRDVPVAQQILDHPDVDALLKQMGGEAVPQRVHGDVFIEAGRRGSFAGRPAGLIAP